MDLSLFTSFFMSFSSFLDHQDKLTAALVMIITKVVFSVTFLPISPLTVLDGFIFGTFWGTIVSIIGNTLGASLAFLLARYLLRNFVENTILVRYPKFDEFKERLFKRSVYTIIVLRLIPIFPYSFLNFSLALTKVSFKDYFIATFFGMIPGTIIFVHFGYSIKHFSLVNLTISILGLLCLILIGKKLK